MGMDSQGKFSMGYQSEEFSRTEHSSSTASIFNLFPIFSDRKNGTKSSRRILAVYVHNGVGFGNANKILEAYPHPIEGVGEG